jgi:hypothetical protein
MDQTLGGGGLSSTSGGDYQPYDQLQGLSDDGLGRSNSGAHNKPRLRWTSELHDRFVLAVNKLGGSDKVGGRCR